MTPEDKARELILKFYPEVQWKLGQEDCIKRAKNCALIAVDEIIYELIEVNKRYHITASPFNYYEQVKKEIEKL